MNLAPLPNPKNLTNMFSCRANCQSNSAIDDVLEVQITAMDKSAKKRKWQVVSHRPVTRLASKEDVARVTDSKPRWTKKARIVKDEKQDDAIKVQKKWVAVPLGLYDDRVKEEKDDSEPSAGSRGKSEDDLEAVKISVQSFEVEMTKTEPDQVALFSSVITALHNLSRILDSNFISDKYDLSYDEIRLVLGNTKRVGELVEQGVHMIRERELQRVLAKAAEIEARTASEIQNHLTLISRLSREKLKAVAEKQNMEKDMENLRSEFEKKLETAKENLRLEIDKQYANAADTLKEELASEQEKLFCHICFSNPRNALVLPCLHFDYCMDCLQKHQKRSKECPTCRGNISGLLLSNLSTV